MAKYIIGCLGVAVIGIILVLVIGGLGYGGMYNSLVGQKQGVDSDRTSVV